MKLLRVIGSVPQVEKRLRLFLADHKFTDIRIDQHSHEIVAARRLFFLWRDYIHLKVSPSRENIAEIEMRVNPLHEHMSEGDERKEMNLQNRLVKYF